MACSQLSTRLRSFGNLFLADRGVRYSLLSRLFTIVFGPLTLLSIGAFLRPEEQGVYYVFGSLLQLGAFIDLGFSKSAQQLLAHAFGSLEINPNGGFVGNQERLAKFLATAKAVIQTYAILGLTLLVILGIVGHFYLARTLHGTMPNPTGPWWAMITSIGIGFGLQSILTIADAANLLAMTNKWRFISEICGIFIFLLVLAVGGGLWASAALAFARCFLTAIPVSFYIGLSTLRQIMSAHGTDFSYRAEILPLQLRNMISYGMGFLVFYCYTPLALSLSGAITAGLIGMSLQIGNIVQSFSTLWFNAQLPLMGNLAGGGSRQELLNLHNKGTKITLLCWILVSSGVIFAAAIGKAILPAMGARYGSLPEIILFIIGSGGLAWAHIRAAFVRAYRIEPLAVLSVIQAAITVILLILTLPRFGTLGAAMTYAVTMTLGGTWAEITYRRFKTGSHKLSFHQHI